MVKRRNYLYHSVRVIRFMFLFNVSVEFGAECPCDYQGRYTVSNRVTYPTVVQTVGVAVYETGHRREPNGVGSYLMQAFRL